MAAQAGLSVAANAFAVVGLADVVFRAGKDIIELLFKIHDAPAELSSLIDAIRVLEGAIAETRSYISDLAASDFVNVDHAIVPDIVFLLQKCQHEFNHLSLVTTATAITPQDGWKRLWKKKAVFALNEKEIERAQRKLQRYTQALNTIVLASEGKNQVLLRNQMSSTRKDLAQSKAEVLQQVASSSEGVRATIMKSIDDIHHAIQASTVDVHATLELESSKIGTSLRHVAGMVEDSRNKTLMESKATEKLIATTSESLRLGIDAQQAVLKTSVTGLRLEQRHGIDLVHRGLQRAHSQQLSVTSRQLRESKRQGRQLKKICGTLMHMASIDVRESANGVTVIVGLNMEELLLPLLLVKSQLAKIIPSLIREGQLILSAEELRWLQDEMAALISEAKPSQYKSTEVKARDHHNTKREKETFSHRSLSADTGSKHVSSSMHNTKGSRTVHSFSTPAGTVCLTMTREVDQCAHDGSRSTDVMTTVQFAFIPRFELCDVGFTAFFSRQEETNIRHRQWRGYKILPADSEVFEIIRNDDIGALRVMIHQRKVFPSDCTTRGQSLAHMAMATRSLKTFELLIDSGGRVEHYASCVHPESLTGLSRYAPEPHSPRRAWQAIAHILYLPGEFERWQHTLPKALAAGLNVPSIFAFERFLSPARCKNFQYLVEIAARVDEDVVWTEEEHYSVVSEICRDCMGCDDPAHNGYSKLFDVIALGVDINSKDRGGQNALHKLCSSTYTGTLTTRCSHPLSALYRARSIRLLLDAGCDPLSLDVYGQSPNDIAGMDIRQCAIFKFDIGPDCLDEWARTSFRCVGLPFPNRLLEALNHLGHCLIMSSDLVTSMGIAYPDGFADSIQCSNLLCKGQPHVTAMSTEPPQSAGPPKGMIYPWFKSSQTCALNPFRPQYALCVSVVEWILNLLTCSALSLKRARKNLNAQEQKISHQAPEPLLHCIEAGVVETVVQLFALSDSPWYNHEIQGWNLLTAAARVDYENLVKLLVEKGVNTDVRTPDLGQGIISIAAQSWSYEMVLLLLEKGVNPNVHSLNENIQSPLISAIVRGDRAMAASLLRYGASPRIVGSHCGLKPGDPLQPLSLAAKYSDTRMLELLLETGAVFGQDDLAIATRYGHSVAVELLLEQGAHPNWHPFNNSLPHSLVSAMKRGDKRVAMILLNHGARPDTSSSVFDLTLWLLAVEAADTDMSRTWRRIRARLLHELLAHATKCSNCEMVQTLLDKGADPNLYPKSLQSPLASAVIRQDLGMVEMLLDYGVSTATLMNANSTTPSALGDVDIVKVLLEHGEIPNMHLRDALGHLKILIGYGSSKIAAASLLDHLPFLSGSVSSQTFHNALFLAAFDRWKLSSWLPDTNHMEDLESNELEAELVRYDLIELLVERRADIDSRYLAHACCRAIDEDDHKLFAMLLKFDAWRARPADLAVTNIIDSEAIDEILSLASLQDAKDAKDAEDAEDAEDAMFVEMLLESGIYPDC